MGMFLGGPLSMSNTSKIMCKPFPYSWPWTQDLGQCKMRISQMLPDGPTKVNHIFL
jgi:hypothetical protein